MRHAAFAFMLALTCDTPLLLAGALQVRLLSSASVIGRQVVVGRAHCAGTTWLLTDGAELTRVKVDAGAVSSAPLRGLRNGEKPWGLACLPNGELWTLVTHDALARLTADGQVVERIRLDRPRLGIYSAGERILLQQPPAGAGTPLLAAGLPRTLLGVVQWPAPVSQQTQSRDEQWRANLVSCGIGVSGDVPCWLANQSRLAISDGTPAHTTVQELRFVREGTVDETAPIWDVALAGSSRVWVLASARAGPDGRRVGGRLTRSNRRGFDEGFVDPSPSARLILWAAENRCVLLSATGQLLEIVAP
jgi:hypothetical protein